MHNRIHPTPKPVDWQLPSAQDTGRGRGKQSRKVLDATLGREHYHIVFYYQISQV
jgi:hypothetical protein